MMYVLYFNPSIQRCQLSWFCILCAGIRVKEQPSCSLFNSSKGILRSGIASHVDVLSLRFEETFILVVVTGQICLTTYGG